MDPEPGENSNARYRSAADAARLEFVRRFEQSCDIAGHMKLRLYAAAAQTDDLDIFVAVEKLDPAGRRVPFSFFAQFEDGPAALGWMRASRRELDEASSTAFQPVLAHRRDLKVTPGEIVPLDIEIWPSGTRIEPGESFKWIVQGTDIPRYPDSIIMARHRDSVNHDDQSSISVGTILPICWFPSSASPLRPPQTLSNSVFISAYFIS